MAAAGEINSTEKGGVLSSNDMFNTENNGTAKFLGPMTAGCQEYGNNTNPTSTKRLLRAELSKSEILNMMCFLEGELEAHETVIAALKSGIKHLPQTRSIQLNDPHAALFRDRIVMSGNFVSRQSSIAAIQADIQVRAVVEQQIDSLFRMVRKQRETNARIIKYLEKKKHEHETEHGLELERAKLKITKNELETEKNIRKQLEDDLKKTQESLYFERDRVKKMVLFLMAERKQIITKYVEERKRSEDLAQILSEEKQRSDAIAEGLEEESKKSLRMEAELENQTLCIENERKTMKLNMAKKDKRIKELEMELVQLRGDIDNLRKQNVPIRTQSSHNVPAPTLPVKIRTTSDDTNAVAQSSVVNVAKIVQPTATVSSVPVSGPTTGIARSLSPGQNQPRQQVTVSNETINAPPAKVTPRKLSNSSSGGSIIGSTIIQQQQQQQQQQSQQCQQQSSPPLPLASLTNTGGILEVSSNASNMISSQSIQVVSAASSQSLAGTLGKIPAQIATLSGTSSLQQQQHQQQQQQTSTILRGGSISSIGTGANQLNNLVLNSSTSAVSGVSSNVAGSNRGIPPPIPPNKPIIPPKREPSISRIGPITTNNSNYI